MIVNCPHCGHELEHNGLGERAWCEYCLLVFHTERDRTYDIVAFRIIDSGAHCTRLGWEELR